MPVIYSAARRSLRVCEQYVELLLPGELSVLPRHTFAGYASFELQSKSRDAREPGTLTCILTPSISLFSLSIR